MFLKSRASLVAAARSQRLTKALLPSIATNKAEQRFTSTSTTRSPSNKETLLVRTALTISSALPQQPRKMATMAEPQHFMMTSGDTDPVWIHTEPYSKRPQFTQLGEDTSADVCIIGAGISGITTAYELVNRGVSVIMLEAREVLSGESGTLH